LDPSIPHRRKNPLTGEWVLVSPHRARRPWQGAVEKLPRAERPTYDPGCYLCPGNERAAGSRNPAYTGTFVFDNDFPALLSDPSPSPADAGAPAWMETQAERGTCRVICYSPRHDQGLGDLPLHEVRAVVDAWVNEVASLLSRPHIGYVQVFENKGEVMGCSNPHPHGQIWATHEVPNEVAKEDVLQASHRRAHGQCLLCRVHEDELKSGVRVICSNDDWTALVPFWAVWPFETLVLPRRHTACLTELDGRQKDSLVALWQRLLRAYDRLFAVTMPFSCGWHAAPKQSADRTAWHLHAHFYPPLLRSATVRKFMVGYEMLGGPQRDLTPEQAAEQLRAVSGA
jgi:UDPglucose--hexose-1-phosphate uridylyltransferase